MKRWVSILTTCAAGSVRKGKDIGNYMFTYRNVNIIFLPVQYCWCLSDCNKIMYINSTHLVLIWL